MQPLGTKPSASVVPAPGSGGGTRETSARSPWRRLRKISVADRFGQFQPGFRADRAPGVGRLQILRAQTQAQRAPRSAGPAPSPRPRRALHAAIEAGVNLTGYYAWSLLDNLEWSLGYSKHFGLDHADFAMQKRTPKASASCMPG